MIKAPEHPKSESALAPELRDTFNSLVEDYKISAKSHTGQVWVNYKILSDLILNGWRKEHQTPPFGGA